MDDPRGLVPMGQQRSGRIRVVVRDNTTGVEGQDDSDGLLTLRGQAPVLLTVTGITPTQGANTGGRRVTVTGSGFVGDTKLFIGSVEAPNLQFVNAQTLMADTPTVNKIGQANLRVENPNATEAVLNKGFTYTNPPKINEISPNAGPINSTAQQAAVRGTFFQAGVKVFFIDKNMQSKEANVRSFNADKGEILVNVPVSPQVGPVRVKVVNPDEGADGLPEGYTYQSTRQQQRARIRKIFPTAVLENTAITIDVYGNNLHDAYVKGTFGPRCSKLEHF